MLDNTKEILCVVCGVALVVLCLFGGLSLCIHVYGLHWAKAEVQNAMHYRVVTEKVEKESK